MTSREPFGSLPLTHSSSRCENKQGMSRTGVPQFSSTDTLKNKQTKRIATTMIRNKLQAVLMRIYSTKFFRKIKSSICLDLEAWLKGRVLRLLIFECPSSPVPFTNVKTTLKGKSLSPFLTDGAIEDGVLINQPKDIQLITGMSAPKAMLWAS